MSDLQTELGQLRTYVQYLKGERDTQKQKEEKEKWTRWVSLTIVFLAVGAALANQQYGGFSGRAVRSLNHAAIAQGNATNKWSYYQSVSIKLHMYEFEARRTRGGAKPPRLDVLGVPAAVGDSGEKPQKKEPRDKAEKKDKSDKKQKKAKPFSLDRQIKKYTKQKPEIMEDARKFEAAVDVHRKDSEEAQRHTKELTLALAVLQVAIAVGSIAALARKKPLWFISMIIGAYGVFQTFNGIFLWM